MRLIFTLTLSLLLISLVSSNLITDGSIDLKKGKNFIIINSTTMMLASDIISLNPEITSISYLDNNKSIGYVNVLSGIGKNFIITPEKIYEINSNKEVKLKLP